MVTKTPRAVWKGAENADDYTADPDDIVTLHEETLGEVEEIDGRLATVEAQDLDTRTTALEGTLTGGTYAAGGPVALATTENIATTGEQTIDGVLTSSTRILVKDKTAQNGIWITASGAWTRATDMDTAGEVRGTLVYVTGGAVNAGKTFYTGSEVTTLDTDPIVFAEAQNTSGLQDQIDLKANTADLGSAAIADAEAFATAAQGATADSAIQPDDLAPVATSGLLTDLSDATSTGDPEVAFAWTFEGLERTWLEVDLSGNPTPQATGRMVAALDIDTTTLVSTGWTPVEDIAFALTFADDQAQTWLQVNRDGAPTTYAALMLTTALSVADLTSAQISSLKVRLNVGTGTPPDTVQVATVAPAIALSGAPQGLGREYPTLVKQASNPVLELADQTANGLLWPHLIDLSLDGVGSGIGMVWSTDHGTHSNSGTWLATAGDIDGPWTQRGRIFLDNVSGGEQNETPSVMWDEVAGEWLMFYQLKFLPGSVGSQATLLATAPYIIDGDGNLGDWTVQGIVIDELYAANAGDGHTGYFKPFRYGGGWYGHGLYGGTNNSRSVFWTSEDGRVWMPSTQIIGHNQHLLNHLAGFADDWLFKVNSGTVIEKNGNLWWIGPVGPAAAGGAEAVNRICAMPLARDGVTFGRAVDITPALQAWEDETLGVDQIGNALPFDGGIYVPYRGGGAYSGFGIARVF